MYKESATNLLELATENVRDWLNTFNSVLTDCDGVLWNDDNAIEGSPDVINAFKAAGKTVLFVTNNGTKTRSEIWQRAHKLGYQIAETDIITPTTTIAEYLLRRQFKGKVFVVGPRAIHTELNEAGIATIGGGPDLIDVKMNDYIQREIVSQQADDVNAVVIGFDEHFTFPKLLKAGNYLGSNADCLFIATNIDAVHKYPKFHIPGTGAIVRAVETCAGRQAIVLGKPNPYICEDLIRNGTITPARTLMIGDCCKVDMPFGRVCGFQTLLVGSGSYQLDTIKEMMNDDANADRQYIPDVYLPKLGDLLQYL